MRSMIFYITCLLGLCLFLSSSWAAPLRGVYAPCTHDAQCKTAYCFEKRCVVWGDQLQPKRPNWSEVICRGHEKRLENAACCYNRQCCSGWCAYGLCSKIIPL